MKIFITIIATLYFCNYCKGQACISYDSVNSTRMIKRAFNQDGNWSSVVNSDGYMVFTSKKQSKKISTIKSIPVFLIDINDSINIINKGILNLYRINTEKKAGIIVSINNISLIIANVYNNKIFRVTIDNDIYNIFKNYEKHRCTFFYDSWFRTYGYFYNKKIYLFDEKSKLFIEFTFYVSNTKFFKKLIYK